MSSQPYGSAYGEPVPEQVLMLASTQNLGRLNTIVLPARNIGHVAIFAALGLFPCLFLFGRAWIGGVMMAAIMWPLLAVAMLRSPLVVRRLARRRIYFYDHGIVEANGNGRFEAYRWDRIVTVFQQIVRTSYNGVPTGTRFLYTITRDDGRTVKLTNFWKDVASLGREINLRVSNIKLPAMRAALAAGHSIQFGDITVNAAGVAGKRGSVPWSEISRVVVRNGQVSLMRAGKLLSLSSTPASKIPNLPLFLHLTTTYHEQAQHQTRQTM